MTVYNTNSVPHKQHFYGLSTDVKSTSAFIGDLFIELDTGDEYIWKGIEWIFNPVFKQVEVSGMGQVDTVPVTAPDQETANQLGLLRGILKQTQTGVNQFPIIVSGTTTNDGTDTGLIDSNKNFEADSLNYKIIKLTVNGTEYIRSITGSIANTIAFATLGGGASDSVILSGDPDGYIVISCKALGISGYSAIIVAGTGIEQPTKVTFANDLLTIESPTDVNGDPSGVYPGTIESLINNTPELAALFEVSDYAMGEPLDIMAEPIAFSMGSDPTIVPANTDYVVLDYSLNSVDFTFHDESITSNSGSEFTVGNYKTLTVEIYGTSTTRTVNFKCTLASGNPLDLRGVKLSDFSTANSTTGNAEAWQFDITGLETVFFGIAAVEGGNVSIKGRAVI